MSYTHLFGPVPSRRLGVSLGVDLVPHKVCSLDCVYCECGATTNLTVERDEYVPYAKVIEELDHFLANHPLPDYITFSGAGEPTLNSRIGDIISYLKENYPEIPIAVLTNGTLLHDPKVRSELLAANLVIPSLDAAVADSFDHINRPHSTLDVETHIRGLRDFSREFSGEIWLELFILPGFSDDKRNLAKIKEAVEQIQPDRIQLNTLDRPGTEEGLQPASHQMLQDLVKEWDLPGLEIIAAVSRKKDATAYREDVEQAIYETISRRPCTIDDLNRILNLHSSETNKYLAALEADGRIHTVSMERGLFYQVKR